MRTITCTAAALNAMICFTSAGTKPPIAFDRADLAEPLAAKLRAATDGKERSDHVKIHFFDVEKDLQTQFEQCAEAISHIFKNLEWERPNAVNPPETMNELTVIIKGPQGSGKSVLAMQLRRMLMDCGITSILHDGNVKCAAAPTTPKHVPSLGQDMTMANLHGKTKVHISTEQTP